MTAIKERPILFSGPMIRALLEGRKTVTRRTVKGAGLKWLEDFTPEYVADPANSLCPYGKPVDRLWVRETHADIGCRLTYRADTDDGAHCQVKKWTPAIHMFRKHSRILLEITDVRVERLQNITEDQAKAEGCFFTDYGRKCGHTGSGWTEVGDCPAPQTHHPQRNGWMWDKTSSSNECLGTATWAFANLWQSVGGAWDMNPWVWVVEFKRVTP